MAVETCQTCGQPLPREQQALQFGEDGLPEACAVMEIAGVPLVRLEDIPRLLVFCDGAEVEECCGYDRTAGVVWRFRTENGQLVTENGEVVIEPVRGAITVARGEG